MEQRLDEMFVTVQRSIRACEENSDDPRYEASAFGLAVWAHAELIRIHPFEDGNGRASRVLLNLLLVRLGLRPFAVELTKQEYIALLNHYFKTKELQPLVDGLMLAAAAQYT